MCRILFTSVPGHHQYAPRSNGVAGLDVPIAVSDGVAPVEIEIEIPGRPIASTAIAANPSPVWSRGRRSIIGVMRAIIDRVNPRALRSQRLLHPLVNLDQRGFGEITARDARLIG